MNRCMLAGLLSYAGRERFYINDLTQMMRCGATPPLRRQGDGKGSTPESGLDDDYII